MDKYEASVWSIPNQNTTNAPLVDKVRNGTVTLNDLNTGGAIQLGTTADDYPCGNNGNNCKGKIFAISIPGVTPASRITWFQAQMACANSLKLLPTNAEWQLAAEGTPDPEVGPVCNVSSGAVRQTGANADCKSKWGAFDMVGNVTEWVADWTVKAAECIDPIFPATGDENCMGGVDTAKGPAAIHRGGHFKSNTPGAPSAGVFDIEGDNLTKDAADTRGFRCRR
jgi:formylglycine-generating enzyme required for sulfatase activity